MYLNLDNTKTFNSNSFMLILHFLKKNLHLYDTYVVVIGL